MNMITKNKVNGEFIGKAIDVIPRDFCKEINPIRSVRTINCSSCDKREHYRYTREELIDRFYKPNGPLIKPCITDYTIDVIWLNYKLEDEIEVSPRDGLEPTT